MKTGTWMTGAIFTLILIIILALLKVSGSFGVVALLLGAGLSVGLALIFILRRNLDSSIYSFAVMALLLIQAAPSFTFDPISREAIKYIKERQNQVAVVKTQVYQLSYLLDRKVVQVVNSDELQNIAIAGGFIITSRTNRDALMPEGVSSSPGLREICQWEKWKESVTADQVLQALLTGNTSDLVEPVYLLSGLKP